VWCSTGHVLSHGWCRSAARSRVFRTTRTLASPTLGSCTPATMHRGDGGQPHQPPPLDAEPRDGAHGSGCSSKKLRLPPSQQSPHQRMERQAPMITLSFSSNCCGPMPARDASPQTVCRWVPGAGSCGHNHTTKTNYVVCVHCHLWVFGWS